jgi:hypothetical protein
VIHSLGHSFTFTFGRMSTFLVPIFIDYMRSKNQFRNALCFIAPFDFFAIYLCFHMPKIGNIGVYVIEEEEEDRIKNREIEMDFIRTQMKSKQ